MRIPRPQGATYLAKVYQQTGANEAKANLFKHLITIYTLDGFRYNNHQVSIPKLAEILKIPTEEIMAQVADVGSNLGNLASSQNIEKTIKSIVTLATTWAIQDRGLISDQVNQLLKSQGKSYKPFISGEVNKSLKLLLESNKNLMESYKTFFSAPSTTNILNVYGSQKDNQELLTPDKALELIHSNTKALSGKSTQIGATSSGNKLAEDLFKSHNLGECQDVRENRSGTEALIAPELDGPEANMPDDQGVAKLQGPTANPKNLHGNQRNEQYTDVDSLPV